MWLEIILNFLLDICVATVVFTTLIIMFEGNKTISFNWVNKINTLFKRERRTVKKKVLSLTLHKEGMETVLNIKAAKEIEDFFRNSAKPTKRSDPETETSKKWLDKDDEGLEFYKKNEKLGGRVASYGRILDNFGNGLLGDNGEINLALLRIVGISSEDGVSVKTEDLLGYQEMKEYIEKLAQWTKAFYEENLRDQDLSAEITFEV